MKTLPVHKCSDPECCSFGQITTKNCGCHKTTEQLLIEERNELLDALWKIEQQINYGQIDAAYGIVLDVLKDR